jgi:hypothetical protein
VLVAGSEYAICNAASALSRLHSCCCDVKNICMFNKIAVLCDRSGSSTCTDCSCIAVKSISSAMLSVRPVQLLDCIIVCTFSLATPLQL